MLKNTLMAVAAAAFVLGAASFTAPEANATYGHQGYPVHYKKVIKICKWHHNHYHCKYKVVVYH